MQFVFDSSTLILIAKEELLRTVTSDFEVIIPDAVKKECTVKDSFDSKLISTIIKQRSIKVLKINDKEKIKKLQKDFKINIGEAEALTLAIKMNKPTAVDDLLTIKACKILNHEFTTAIHFLIYIAKTNKINKQEAFIKLTPLANFF